MVVWSWPTPYFQLLALLQLRLLNKLFQVWPLVPIWPLPSISGLFLVFRSCLTEPNGFVLWSLWIYRYNFPLPLHDLSTYLWYTVSPRGRSIMYSKFSWQIKSFFPDILGILRYFMVEAIWMQMTLVGLIQLNRWSQLYLLTLSIWQARDFLPTARVWKDPPVGLTRCRIN